MERHLRDDLMRNIAHACVETMFAGHRLEGKSRSGSTGDDTGLY